MSTSIPSANTSPIPGASFSRAELVERARRAENDPERWAYTALNIQYLDLLDQYDGATVGDIVTTADQVASDAHQKANVAFIISLGGGVAAAAGAVLGMGGFSLPLAIGLGLAGLGVGYVAMAIGDGARGQEGDAEVVSDSTAYFAQLMAEEAKTQPAPAPAQPAPATTVPQRQPPEPAPVG